MRIIKCEQCGANDFSFDRGFRVCKYCGAKYLLETTDIPYKETTINIGNDVRMLLEKCKKEPTKAKRYANLILDIDPDNKEALRYL